MSLENIINYTMKTPANTNPAVMSSVINSSFKQTKEEILNEAKAYSDSKGGYTKTEKIPSAVTFDQSHYATMGEVGEYFEKNVGGNPALYMKLMDRPIKKSEVESITVIEFGEETTTAKSDLVFADISESLWGVGNGYFDIILSASIDTECDGVTVPRGTWGVWLDGEAYVTAIDGVLVETETVIPIDPKYLPESSGGGLPVVEIEVITTDGVALSEEQAAILDSLNGMPFILNANTVGDFNNVRAPMTYMELPAAGIRAYIVTLFTLAINITTNGNGWSAKLEEI